MTEMELEFWVWARDNITPWPHPEIILNNYWIVWQASWQKSRQGDDDGRQ
jgi:hypothetical protein